jgi:hypothetical protein
MPVEKGRKMGLEKARAENGRSSGIAVVVPSICLVYDESTPESAVKTLVQKAIRWHSMTVV